MQGTLSISIPLKLRSRSAWPNTNQSAEEWDDAELWVVNENWQETLTKFVKNSDDGVVNQLLTAFGVSGRKNVFVIKVKKGAKPPILIIPNAVAYRPYLRMENLYVPIDKDLSPPMRRDVARTKLATDPNLLYWTEPTEGSSFRLNSIPIGAFKPMHDRIEYVIVDDPEQLYGWRDNDLYALEKFACDEDEIKKKEPKPPKEELPELEEPVAVVKIAKKVKEPPPKIEELSVVKEQPNVVERKLRECEAQWLAVKGSMDDPARLALWEKMRMLNSALGRNLDAMICWMNSLWENEQ